MKPKQNPKTRREFLKRSTMFAIGISLAVVPSCKDEREDEPDVTCETTDDILGPFYKSGAPIGENIIPAGASADPLIVEGRVLTNCVEPIQGAMVEIWNADDVGAYDSSDNYFFRGRYQSGSDGIYRFRTIIPGRYLNGSTYRPSHIHFRITAPGYIELVSQIYFKDDPFIATDPWASASKAQERILPISQSTDGTDIITFDIHMKKES